MKTAFKRWCYKWTHAIRSGLIKGHKERGQSMRKSKRRQVSGEKKLEAADLSLDVSQAQRKEESQANGRGHIRMSMRLAY